MSEASAIQRLVRIETRLLGGHKLAVEDSVWFGEGMRTARKTGCTIEDALGLAPNWSHALLLQDRICALGELYPAELSAREVGVLIERELIAYRSNYFQKDRTSTIAPEGRRGVLFRILLASNGKVLGDDRIRKLVGYQRASQCPTTNGRKAS